MKIKIQIGKKFFTVEVKEMKGINKAIGLMFNRDGIARLFDFKKRGRIVIHSFFCPEFLALWMDEDNNVLESRIIKPYILRIKPKNNYVKLLEIPVNKKYLSLIDFVVDNERFIKERGFKVK